MTLKLIRFWKTTSKLKLDPENIVSPVPVEHFAYVFLGSIKLTAFY